MEVDQENDFIGFREDDIKMDVKLSFGQVCNLIDSLEFREESFSILRGMETCFKNIIEKIKLEKKKENEVRLESFSSRPTNTPMEVPEISTTTRINQSIIDQSQVQENENTSMFYSGGDSRLLHTSTQDCSSFRPLEPSKSLNNSNIGASKTIIEGAGTTSDFESEPDHLYDNMSIRESENDANFVLKNWTIKKDKKNLLLTGVKMDRKGNIIERDFISSKVIARREKDIVKTADGLMLLEEGIVDKVKSIPKEVRSYFKNNEFPKQWRKALKIWEETEGKKLDESKEKPKKSTPKQVVGKSNKINPNLSKEKKVPQGKSSSKKDKSESENRPQKKKRLSKDTSTVKKAVGKKQKAKKEDSIELERRLSVENLLDLIDPNDKEVADLENVTFHLPQTSLTPNGLLGSLKKTSIKGRYTPPTKVFDKVYGRVLPSPEEEEEDSCHPTTGNKNSNVLKRMIKVNKASKTANGSKPSIVEKSTHKTIAEVIKGTASKKVSAPQILKEMFGNIREESDNDDEDDVDF